MLPSAPSAVHPSSSVSHIPSAHQNSKKIIDSMRDLIKTVNTAKIDYARIVDMNSLKDVDEIRNEALIALAVFVGKTRLIDNIIVGTQND